MPETAAVSADPASSLAGTLRTAIASVTGLPAEECDPQIRPSANPQFGDFQANFAMSLAKRIGTNPRQLANDVLAKADLTGIADKVEVAGPGFVNVHLSGAALASALDALDSPALGIRPVAAVHAVTIDLCGVNVAKQMHVGHLRATIIGDTLARDHERLGRKVWRENHLGDWGLPIAMTLAALRRAGADLASITLDDLNRAYRAAQLEGRDDAAGIVAARAFHAGPHRIAELEAQNAGAAMAQEDARATLVRLQSGDAQLVADWQRIIDLNLTQAFILTKRLGGAMIPRKWGRIINIASINALWPGKAMRGRSYEASKGALAMFTKAVAADWAVHGITVNAIAPGPFLTDANRRWIGEKPEFEGEVAASIPVGRWGRPEEIGPLALYLASEASSFMTGSVLVLDGGKLLW